MRPLRALRYGKGSPRLSWPIFSARNLLWELGASPTISKTVLGILASSALGILCHTTCHTWKSLWFEQTRSVLEAFRASQGLLKDIEGRVEGHWRLSKAFCKAFTKHVNGIYSSWKAFWSPLHIFIWFSNSVKQIIQLIATDSFPNKSLLFPQNTFTIDFWGV